MVGLSRRGSYSNRGRGTENVGRGGGSLGGGLSGFSKRNNGASSSGFSAPPVGRGMMNNSSFLGFLSSLNCYLPQFSDEDWEQLAQQPNASTLPTTSPRVGCPPRRGSTSNSQSISYALFDEDEVEEEREDEEAREEAEVPENEETNVTTTPTHMTVRQPTALKDGMKCKAWIRPGTNDVLEPSNKCSRWISGKFKEKLDKEFTTWGKVSLEQKNSYFAEFGKGFEWEEGEETAIRAAWNKKACKAYAQLTCRARKTPTKPSYILNDVWVDWTEVWETLAFKERSAKMKANRGRASTHTGGTRSFANHADVLKEKLQVDRLPAHTLFQHNHSTGHDMKTWVSSKAHSVEEAYQREIALSAESGSPLDEDKAFFRAAGGLIKGNVYALGDARKIYYASSSSSSRLCASGRSIMGEMAQLRQALQLERAEREKLQSKIDLVLKKNEVYNGQ